MKTCPTCGKTYEQRFQFCLIDGAVLVAADDDALDEPSEVSEITQPLGDSDLVELGPSLDEAFGDADEEVTKMTLEPDIPAEARRPDGQGPLQTINSSALPIKSGEIVLDARLPPRPEPRVAIEPSKPEGSRQEAVTIEPAGAPTMELSGLREMAQAEQEARAVVGEAIDAVLARGEEKLPETKAAPAVGVLASDGRELRRLIRPRLTWLWIGAAATIFTAGIVIALLVTGEEGPLPADGAPQPTGPTAIESTTDDRRDVAKAEPTKTAEPAKAEPAMPAKAEPTKTAEPAKAEPAMPAKAEPTKTAEPAKAEPAMPAKAEPTKTAEPAKAAKPPVKPRPKKRAKRASRRPKRKARRRRGPRPRRARRPRSIRRSLDKATVDPFAE